MIKETTGKPQIYVTSDYTMFKTIKGNRKLNTFHLGVLAKSFAVEDLSREIPIVVNEHMEVVDGQHRLEFRSQNGLPIYYTIREGANLETVQRINTASKRWDFKDYLESFVEQGKQPYIEFKRYMQEYQLGFTPARYLIAVVGDNRTFKKGDLELLDEETILLRLEAYNKLKGAIVEKVRHERNFVQAFVEILDKVSVEELLQKMASSGKTIEYSPDRKEYLRQIEYLINWKTRGAEIRLF